MDTSSCTFLSLLIRNRFALEPSPSKPAREEEGLIPVSPCYLGMSKGLQAPGRKKSM